MKSKSNTLLLLVILFSCSFYSNAQDWIGSGVHTNMVRRDGNVFIGLTAGSTKLHVYSSTTNSQMTVCGPAPCIRFNEGDGGNQNEERVNIGMATNTSGGGHYFANAYKYDMILRANTSTGNILFGTGNPSAERMRIAVGGNIGIVGTGTSFSNTDLPLKLLHLRAPSSTIRIDASSGSPGLEFASGSSGVSGTVTHDINYSTAVVSSGQFKIGPTSPSLKSIYFRIPGTGSIVFSNSPSFATSGNTGLNGTYLFDAQVSTTSLMVAPAGASGSYPSLPGGYLFNVQGGHSNFNGRVNVNYATSTTPDNTWPGLNICNTSTYYYIQTNKSKPLALNPIPHNGPSKDSSYVAIGFTPGTYNVPLNYKLAVKGKIICEELKVKFAGLWSDYVFEKDYKLRELKEVEKYIEENKHLPDVPSETEVKENGFETGQMDATLLRKIEELTLYMIEMNKQIDQLKKENVELKQAFKK